MHYFRRVIQPAGENTLSLYKINDETGLLEKRFTLPVSGVYPKRVVPFPDSRHVAVANNSSNTVTTFTIDYEKNTLIMKGRPQKVDQPNSIVFKLNNALFLEGHSAPQEHIKQYNAATCDIAA